VFDLCKVTPELDYFRKFGEHVKGQGFAVQIAQYIDINDQQFRYFNAGPL